jgi:hypothetical protein
LALILLISNPLANAEAAYCYQSPAHQGEAACCILKHLLSQTTDHVSNDHTSPLIFVAKQFLLRNEMKFLYF